MANTLREELEVIVKSWKSCKPKATIAQLIIIALLMHDEPLSTRDIYVWLTKIPRNAFKRLSSELDLCPVEACHRGFVNFNIPLIRVNMPTYEDDCFHLHDRTIKWTTPAHTARAFLKSVLCKRAIEEATRTFPFMDLPVELRLHVFENALRYPQIGLVINRGVLYCPKGLRNTDWDKIAPPPECKALPFSTRCGKARELLAILQVSKQIYHEAMPVFYSRNNFLFTNTSDMLMATRRMPYSREIHLRHISFNYSKYKGAAAASAMRSLKSMTHLRELEVWMDLDEWRQAQKYNGKRMYPDLFKIPGIPTLRSIRGLRRVQFHGNCEAFKQLIPEMTQQRVIKGSKKAKVQLKAIANGSRSTGTKN